MLKKELKDDIEISIFFLFHIGPKKLNFNIFDRILLKVFFFFIIITILLFLNNKKKANKDKTVRFNLPTKNNEYQDNDDNDNFNYDYQDLNKSKL